MSASRARSSRIQRRTDPGVSAGSCSVSRCRRSCARLRSSRAAVISSDAFIATSPISRAANRNPAGGHEASYAAAWTWSRSFRSEVAQRRFTSRPAIGPASLPKPLKSTSSSHLQHRPVVDGTQRVTNAAREGLAVLLLLEHGRCLGTHDPRTHLLLHACSVDVVVARVRPRVPRRAGAGPVNYPAQAPRRKSMPAHHDHAGPLVRRSRPASEHPAAFRQLARAGTFR
jgi:hypothetical protein